MKQIFIKSLHENINNNRLTSNLRDVKFLTNINSINDKVEMYLSIFQGMLIYDYVTSTSQDMYRYGGLNILLFQFLWSRVNHRN